MNHRLPDQRHVPMPRGASSSREGNASSWLRPAPVQLVLFAALYLFGAWLGSRLLMGSGVAAPWWPGGLYLAALLLSERRHWPWWVSAAFIADTGAGLWLFGFGWSEALLAYLSTTATVLVGAGLLRLAFPGPFLLRGLREVLALVLAAAALAPVVGATLSAATLSVSDWPSWWLSDATGILILTPLVLAAFELSRAGHRPSVLRWAEAGAVLAGLVAACLLVFTGRFPFAFVILPFLLWAALRFEVAGAALASCVLSAIALSFTVVGEGRFALPGAGPHERVWQVQLFLGLMGLTALLVAVRTRQHREAREAVERAYAEVETQVEMRTAELQESREGLRLAHERLLATLEASPVTVFAQDRDLRYRWIENLAVGWHGEALIGRTDQDSIERPEDAERLTAIKRRVLATGVPAREEVAIVEQGETRWFDLCVRPQGGDGGLGGILCTAVDITERKREEAERRRTELRLHLASEAARLVAFDWDIQRDQVCRYISPYAALPPTPPGQPTTFESVNAAVHPEDRARFMAQVKAALGDRDGSYQNEYRVVSEGGEVIWLHERGRVERDGEGRPEHLIGISHDITERKRAEEHLLIGQRLFREAERLADLGAWQWDSERDLVTVSEGWRRIHGCTREVMAVDQILSFAHPDDLPAIQDALQAAVRGEGPYRIEHRIVRGDTGEVRWVAAQGERYCDPQGRFTVLGAAQDITERKQAEEALREADRRKDAFLATLAHELRNPLAPLRTGLDLIKTLNDDAAACEEPLRIMDRQLTHLVRLVDDLLDVSRISRGKIRLRKERLDLAEIIEAALDMSESGLSRGDRHLTVSVPSQPLPVEGDRVRLVQVVSNLLNNAAKFTDTGGHIDLRVVPQTDQVEIRVQDDGRGIPASRLSDMFEMFAQDEPGRTEGLGIGLNIVRSLVAMHGGTVRADSEGPGRGASFTVTLPICHGAPQQPTSRKTTEADLLPPTCRVLVVDDNRAITEVLRLLLTKLKAEVRVAHDGAEALRICEDWQPTHVLMDLGMPGMDGFEVARRLRASHPGRAFRLVAVTGWGQDKYRQQAREAGFDQYFVKPVGVRELKTILSS